MSDEFSLKLPQNRETTVTAHQRRAFGYRYAYSRSHDSLSANDPGQDFLALRENQRRLAFALCDGVGQSFYGELGARLLGEALLDYLWTHPLSDLPTFHNSLAIFLDRLVEPATRQIEAHAIPENLPPMLQEVLEKKRAIGSESTFACGLLDLPNHRLGLAWMGDSRLRLWGAQGEITDRLGDAFHTQERWSSRRGRIGELHTAFLSTGELRYLTAYSDGLAILDTIMRRHFRDASIDAIIQDALLRPESDDISFFEVWIGEARPIECPPLPAPAGVRLELEAGCCKLSWRPLAGAARYEVRLSDGQSFNVYTPRHAFDLPEGSLTSQNGSLRIRAWDEEPGEWTSEVPYVSS